MHDEYINYFQSNHIVASETKINTLVNSIERKALYPVYLNFHIGSIEDNEKIIKDFEKQANYKKNAAIKEDLLKAANPYRNTVKKHQIAIRLIKDLQ